MASSLKTRQRRARQEIGTRGHVRPSARTQRIARGEMGESAPQRMSPLSRLEAASAPTLAQRRAARREQKKRAQAARVTPPVRVRLNPLQLLGWRAVSGMIVAGLSVVLYLFLTADAFYVSSVAIGGEKYLTREEIFRFSDVAQRHIFWIDPDEVEARLERVANIADAKVYVGWPPDMVQIIVTEREPALIWEQSVRVWVDVNGIVMTQREDRPELLRIVASNVDEPLDVGARVPQTIVDGALQLRQRHPNIDVLVYDPLKGLGYRDGGGWTVWFGDGHEIDTKLLVYYRVVESIKAKGIQPGDIYMNEPDRPVYTVLWRENG